MFTPPSIGWVEECRRAWLDGELKEDLASIKDEKISRPREAEREAERVCFYTETASNQPAVMRKRHAPVEGVSFF